MLSKSGVKYIQSLYHKKFRDLEKAFIIEGPKLVAEFLNDSPMSVRGVYGVKSWLNSDISALSNIDKNLIHLVEDFELEKISALSTPNQVLAVVQKKEPSTIDSGIILLLDDIQDPGNMGTIVRIADWFGVAAVVCSHASADLYSPKVVQSTMGSILRVNVVYTDLQEWCRQYPNPIYATTLHGKPLGEIRPDKEFALLIGNESKGVKDELLQIASQKITIPGKGAAESLNAAVATGIVLSHLVK